MGSADGTYVSSPRYVYVCYLCWMSAGGDEVRGSKSNDGLTSP